ncbi:DUF2789 domain-containing protein [Jeongeupia sp. USM3]|uniref:DUF2789 domain-containing protein n=1 Tax=Jeongeupia sp. USM3 TaxID=1906741 RepID=UPI00089DF1FB|nr:DUF2789 domain-containing protein [Jeongeupia sp. USM3]AOX99722.1 hypothetical protein BJP62_04180 [Jeongeupia sp. USM3]
MDTSPHTLAVLFKQLGLPDDAHSIRQFIASHRLAAGVSLPDAPFWAPAQAEFLAEALDDDSDWAEMADELAALLSD